MFTHLRSPPAWQARSRRSRTSLFFPWNMGTFTLPNASTMNYRAHLLAPALLLLTGVRAQVLPDHKNQTVSQGIAYMPNQGQFGNTDHTQNADIEYASTGNPLQLFLAKGPKMSFVSRIIHEDTTIQDTTYRVDMDFIGEGTYGNVPAQPYLETDWYHNYYLPQCPDGVTGVNGYGYLVYENVYPFIDVHVLSNAWGFKFYFVVWPGGDPAEIRMRFSGHDGLEVDVVDGLRILLEDRWLRIPQAIAYQLEGGYTIDVPWTVTYEEVTSDLVISMVFDTYDTTKALVFDISEDTPMGGTPPLPTPEWGTYYNGIGAEVYNAARTSDGGMVTCGTNSSGLFLSPME